MTSCRTIIEPALHALRTPARAVRKRAKRLYARGMSAWLRLRTLTDRGSVVGDAPLVVSLTTYGARLQSVSVAVESIARGSVRPQRLILWLDDPVLFDRRPASVRRLERRGLEVKLAPNFGPHTKYFPYVSSVPRHSIPLVTADDDIMYPRQWLKRLWEAHQADPDRVHCYWASVVKATGPALEGYLSWPNCTDTRPGFDRFALGVSGVIYPPAMLDGLRAAGTAFTDLSPTADDVWLHWMALRQGTPIRQVGPTPRHFLLIPGTQRQTLMETNNIEGEGNDRWIRGLYSPDDVAIIRSSVPPARPL